MTVYARSDLSSVSLSAAHGGCGEVHVRPAPGGKPERLWALSCSGGCEDHLRHDPLWSTTMSEIPETYDEGKSREDFDKRGAKDRNYIQLLIMAKMADVELPESMKQPLLTAKEMPDIGVLMECPSGHPGKPGSKFCATCGEAMQQPVNALTAAPVLCAEGHENAATAKFCAECGIHMSLSLKAPQAQDAHLTPGGEPEPAAGRKVRLRDMRLEDLQAKARDAGLDDGGTRVELIDRLRAVPVAA